VASARPFSSKLPKGTVLEKDAAILMEFDSSSAYEVAIRDFAEERLQDGGEVLAFTSKASPVSNALQSSTTISPFVSMFIMSTSGSGGSSEAPGRAKFIVQNDPDLILNALGRSLKEEPARRKTLIFDNLSELILLLGMEKTYRFAKKANEILFDAGAGSLFLLVSGAHDDRTRTAIESIYRRIILFSREGVKVKK
jgi:hypothetical protein